MITTAERGSRVALDPVGFSRRTALRLGGGALLAAGLLGGRRPTTAQDSTPAAPAPFEGETYIGIADDGVTFVAVVLALPDAATGLREAHAYLCDPPREAWFTGSGTGDALELATDDGATLMLQIGATTVAGQPAMPDGTALSFEASPATGMAGLFTPTIAENGVFQAVSADGLVYLEGLVISKPVEGGAAGQVFPAVAAAVPQTGPVAAILGGSTEPGDYTCRLIVLSDGQSKSVGKTRGGEGFAIWEPID